MNSSAEKTHTLRNTAIFAFTLFIALLFDGLAGRYSETSPLYFAARLFSGMGNGVFLFGASIVLLIYGFYRRNDLLKSAALLSVASTGLAGLAVNVLKAAIERPRIQHAADAVMTLLNSPSLYHTNGHFSSFPSGHTTASFAAAYAFASKYPKFKIPLYAAAALVAIARIYLGAHYPSDVAGGAALGIFVGWLVTSKDATADRWKRYALALLVIFVSFFKLGGYLVFDLDEAIYAESAREMLELGDVLTPMYNYKPMLEKPPVLFWLMMAGYKLFGITEFAARVFEALSGALLAWMTFAFVKRLRGEGAAMIAVVALVLNIEYFVYTHAAITDMTLALFFAGALFSFYIGVHEAAQGTAGRKWFVGFWVFCGLGVLTKGAIGIVLPFGVAFWYLVLARKARLFKPLFSPLNIALFILTAGPWFAAEFYVNGREFYDVFIVTHHIKRYTGALSGHGGPVYYYLPVLVIGFFPWVAFVPEAFKRAYDEFANKNGGLYLFSAIWFVIIFGFFSTASTKLPNYIVPVLPAVAVMAALAIYEKYDSGFTRYSVYILAALPLAIAAGLTATSITGVKTGVDIPLDFYNRMLGLVFNLGVFFAVAAVFAIAALRYPRLAIAGLCATVFVLLVYMRLAVVPPVNVYMQNGLFKYAQYAKELGADAHFSTYRINRPSVVFYAGRKITEFDEKSVSSLVWLKGKEKVVMITDRKHYPELAQYNLMTIAEDHEFMLLTNAADMPALK